MSTHVLEFQSFFRFFASFCIGQISHQQHKGYMAVHCTGNLASSDSHVYQTLKHWCQILSCLLFNVNNISVISDTFTWFVFVQGIQQGKIWKITPLRCLLFSVVGTEPIVDCSQGKADFQTCEEVFLSVFHLKLIK